MGDTDSKVCTRCMQIKLLAEFGNEKKGRYGKSSRCKSCARLMNVEYQARPGIKEKYAALNSASYVKRRDEERFKSGWVDPSQRTEKPCSACQLVRPVSDFYADKRGALGRSSRCKSCAKRHAKLWDQANSDRVAARLRAWKVKNRPRLSAYAAKYAEKSKSNPAHRMMRWMRTTLRRSLECKGGAKTEAILGFTSFELRAHLERQFLCGMSWDNYGAWEVDHIVPLSSFKVTSVNDPDLRRAWALTNLRPLWASENRKKHAKRIFLI